MRKNHSTGTLELFCAKNRLKKHQKFKKWDHFENRPSHAKTINHAKAIYPFQIGQFGSKIKNTKNYCLRTLKVLLWKKPFAKTPNIRQIRPFWKSAFSGKGYSPCKGYSSCKIVSLGPKLKMPKTCEKPFYRNIRVVAIAHAKWSICVKN